MGWIKLAAAACLMVLGLAACSGDAAHDAEVAGFTPLPGKAVAQAGWWVIPPFLADTKSGAKQQVRVFASG